MTDLRGIWLREQQSRDQALAAVRLEYLELDAPERRILGHAVFEMAKVQLPHPAVSLLTEPLLRITVEEATDQVLVSPDDLLAAIQHWDDELGDFPGE